MQERSATAAILKDTFRDSDVIARLGGDEFAMLAVGANADDPADLERRLHERSIAHNVDTNGSFGLSVSVGVAGFDVDRPCSINELLAQADARMYAQKAGKHERVAAGPEEPQYALNREGTPQ